MCGIVGAVTQRNTYKILIEGLHRLEYRGYDSAGLSIIDSLKVSTALSIAAMIQPDFQLLMQNQSYKPEKILAKLQSWKRLLQKIQ